MTPDACPISVPYSAKSSSAYWYDPHYPVRCLNSTQRPRTTGREGMNRSTSHRRRSATCSPLVVLGLLPPRSAWSLPKVIIKARPHSTPRSPWSLCTKSSLPCLLGPNRPPPARTRTQLCPPQQALSKRPVSKPSLRALVNVCILEGPDEWRLQPLGAKLVSELLSHEREFPSYTAAMKEAAVIPGASAEENIKAYLALQAAEKTT